MHVSRGTEKCIYQAWAEMGVVALHFVEPRKNHHEVRVSSAPDEAFVGVGLDWGSGIRVDGEEVQGMWE